MCRKIFFVSVAVLAFVSSVFLTYVFYFGLRNQVTPKTEIKVTDTERSNIFIPIDKPNAESDESSLDQTVRSLDFNNFTYNWFPKNDTVFKKKIVLRNGQNEIVHLEGKRYGPLGEDYQEELSNVSYADLTGDRKEEAIVSVGVSFYRWHPMCIFVFSEKNKKALQIWSYETSAFDSNLTFRGLRIEDGILVIEEFEEGMAYCCPKDYLRKKFAWNGKTFVMKSLETFPYDSSKDFKGFPSEQY